MSLVKINVMASEPARHFTDLPVELLGLIVADLSGSSLSSFSLVNKKCRAVSVSYLFHMITVNFSERGLYCLEMISESPLASHVKMLHYSASELVDPLIQHWDYFTACIYTPQEYARDHKDFRWGLRGREFSYTAIHSYFSWLAKAQHTLLHGRNDIRIFCKSLSRLCGLKAVKLSFDALKEDQFLWFANRIYVDWKDSFPIHLETVLRSMVTARGQGILIEAMEIEGFYAKLVATDVNLMGTAADALTHVKALKLVDSFSLLDFMSDVAMPSLRRLDLANCWLVGPDLARFMECHASVLRQLHLRNICLPHEKLREACSCSKCAQALMDVLSGIQNTSIFDELTIIRDLENE
ncbi:hypothetical protein NUU61_009362 [Penicillium alfredii]|uniref:F-box domain-containing protein n=1 Tax=Penicillium alfredii TaxID=1506179 RepID=A0A9W9EMY5_9EURO|nr:uncharacterized protein NUU61_009362 [Penicillium alfredii]KAJ5084783.1 hypothetical protein NUU61_009362 [Penicillium alfredii]